MAGKRGPVCKNCDEPGNGKCARCYGTGTNLKLNSAEPKCPFCDGTGQCQLCKGTGIDPEATGGILPDWLRRIFG
jgi:hypothetical protein